MKSLELPLRQINQNLEALRDFVDVLGAFLREKAQKHLETNAPALMPLFVAFQRMREVDDTIDVPPLSEDQLKRLLERYPEAADAKVERDPAGGITVSMSAPKESAEAVQEAIQEIFKAHRRTTMLASSSLLHLTNSVELFFSKLLHTYFDSFPEAIGSKDKIFSFDDLNKFQSVTEARAYYVSSKIEDLLRGSIADWFVFARNTLKLGMGYLKDDQPALEETFQRRNVIVHNGGIANAIYLSKVADDFRSSVALGDDLTPDDDYLRHRIDIWEKACILVAAELWKQIDAADVDRADVLGEIAFKHIGQARFQVAEAICEFVMRDKQMSESTITVAQLNKWQCQKRTGRWSEIQSAVEAADYSAKSTRYRLGYLALLERADEFYSILDAAIAAHEITEDELRQWPIFVDVRKDPRFDRYREKKKTRKRQARKRLSEGPPEEEA